MVNTLVQLFLGPRSRIKDGVLKGHARAMNSPQKQNEPGLGYLIGFGRSRKGTLKHLYWVAIAQFGLFLLTWVLNYAVLDDAWSLFVAKPILWVAQLITILELWHVVAFEVLKVNETRKLIVATALASVNWVLAFVLVIQETVQCGKIEDSEYEAMQQCVDLVSTSVSASTGILCQADVDVGSAATGLCPRLAFGDATSAGFWMFWQFLLVIVFIFTDFYVFYETVRLQQVIEETQLQTPAKPFTVAQARPPSIITSSQPNSKLAKVKMAAHAKSFSFGP
jgi:hypothetical protein